MSRVMMDERYMVNATTIKDALKIVNGANAVEYETMDALCARHLFGVEAQTIEKVAAPAVEIDGLGNRYILTDQLIPILFAAVKELATKNSTLEGSVSTLSEKVTTLESKVRTLESKAQAVEQKVSAAESNISTLQSNISTLQSNDQTTNSAITDLQERVTALETPAAETAKRASSK